MKFSQIVIAILLIASIIKCKSSEVLSINTELAVVEATKTPQEIKRIPGALLEFTIISNKDITLNHVRYWEYNQPITIVKQSNDTIWAEAKFRNPDQFKENMEGSNSLSVQKPIDSTCTILYTYKNENLKLVVPKLKLLKPAKQ